MENCSTRKYIPPRPPCKLCFPLFAQRGLGSFQFVTPPPPPSSSWWVHNVCNSQAHALYLFIINYYVLTRIPQRKEGCKSFGSFCLNDPAVCYETKASKWMLSNGDLFHVNWKSCNKEHPASFHGQQWKVCRGFRFLSLGMICGKTLKLPRNRYFSLVMDIFCSA